MNFDDALNAHAQWKFRLMNLVNGVSQEQLDPAVVGRDDKCALGQWIYGEAKLHSALPDQNLIQVHAAFHREAAQVLSTYQAGQKEKAKAMLEQGHPFHEASLRAITAIRKLRDKVQPN